MVRGLSLELTSSCTRFAVHTVEFLMLGTEPGHDAVDKHKKISTSALAANRRSVRNYVVTACMENSGAFTRDKAATFPAILVTRSASGASGVAHLCRL